MFNKIKYLGFIVGHDQVRMDPDTVSRVLKFKRPATKTQVRAFLGLTNFYKSFILDYSKIALPLYNLTKESTRFEWTVDCEEAFRHLIDKVTSQPILASPDFKKEFILSTDASEFAIGAVLSQYDNKGKEHPVRYYSTKLSKQETNYGVSRKEGLAVVKAIRHFRMYLLGKHFTVFTDHQPLKQMLTTKDPTGQLARWIMILMEFDFTLVYRPGKKNGNADAMSRIHSLLASTPRSPDEYDSSSAVMIKHILEKEQNDNYKGSKYMNERAKNFVITEYFTKWPIVIPVRNANSAVAAEIFFKTVICTFGLPNTIISGRGSVFLYGLFQELAQLTGTKHITTSPYTPSTNGQTERFNKTLCASLAKMAIENNNDWDNHIDSVLFEYRTRVHSTTNETPFKLMFGVEARTIEGGMTALTSIEKRITREKQLTLLNLLRIKQEDTYRENRVSIKEDKYKVGDIVKYVISWKRPRDKMLEKADAPYRIIDANL